MEEALYDSHSIRRFARLSLARDSIPDETTILNFRHLLEKHDIAADALEAVNLLMADQGMMARKGTIVVSGIAIIPTSPVAFKNSSPIFSLRSDRWKMKFCRCSGMTKSQALWRPVLVA